ncbi:MAG: ribosome-associated translation inhibitor RaiA [Candidatus Riflebacteria bacterium]|nr:ribosome-associated translation inhibitor RaiA [Candidatus Riflebacteria bacterium]
MNVIVSGKNMKITAPLREYASDKIEAIQRYFDHIIEADITLSMVKRKNEGQSCRADVTVWANGTVLKSMEQREDMFGAIHGAIQKIERQLKKYKQKLRENPKRKGAHPVVPPPPPEAEPEEIEDAPVAKPAARPKAKRTARTAKATGKPRIIRTHAFAMKPMSVEEAAMQLQVLKQDFMVFANAETNEVNVVYKRSDGNIGLIEPGNR